MHRPALAGGFVGLALVLAYLEEGAWDALVWRQHGIFFGGLQVTALPDTLLTLIVPSLILPQATHYVLDAWIWKFDGSNPGLRTYLFRDGGPDMAPKPP